MNGVRLVAVVCALALGASAAAAERPKIGLVLSGGGARGAAHVGVLKVLEELRIPVDAIAGTSMGAIVGASYASGASVDEMLERIGRLGTAELFRDEPPRQDLPPRRRRDDYQNYVGPEFGVAGGALRLPRGAVAGVRMEAELRALVRSIDERDFDRLPIPFRAVATDLETGRMVVFREGDLAEAMRASMSLPGVVAPARIGGRVLVDGGLTRNLPVDVARAMGVDVLIVVNLGTPLMKGGEIQSLFDVSAQMFNILTEQNVEASLAALTPRDVLISPALDGFFVGDFDRMPEAVVQGEAAARAAAERLRPYSVSPHEYAVWQGQRTANVRDRRPIDAIRIAGTRRVNPEVLRHLIGTRPGAPIDREVLDADVRRIFGRGDFEHVGYRVAEESGRRVLTIQVEEKSWGPDYLRFGVGLSADLGGDAYFQLLGTYRRTWVNALGAEWRTDLLAGRVQRLATEFYQPLATRQAFFVAPSLDLENRPFDVYDGRTLVARFERRTASAGLDVGARLANYGELRFGLVRGVREFQLDTGPSALAQETERIDMGGARLTLELDQLDSSRFPRSGYAAALELFASRTSLGARDPYTRWAGELTTVFTFGDHTVNLAAKGGGALGNSPLPAYDLFQAGGLMQLSGFRTGQLLGQSLAFGRAVYANRLERQTLLEGVFAGFSLEAGKVGDPLLASQPRGLLTAAALFLGVDTPLGPLYLAYGRAKGGNDAVYLYLGRP